MNGRLTEDKLVGESRRTREERKEVQERERDVVVGKKRVGKRGVGIVISGICVRIRIIIIIIIICIIIICIIITISCIHYTQCCIQFQLHQFLEGHVVEHWESIFAIIFIIIFTIFTITIIIIIIIHHSVEEERET